MKLRYGSPEEVGMSPAKVRQTESAMKDWAAREGQQAAAWLAARRGVIVTHQAVGCLRPEPDSPPVALDSLFCIASVSKPMTATATLILVEEGRLGLNHPASLYVPELTGEGKDAIAVIHLLTHTSGMRDQEVDEHARKVEGTVTLPPPEPTQHPEIAKYLAPRYGAPVSKSPGQEMSYCNYGYCLLGEVIRRVCGQSLADFARQRVFEPLGMKDTHYGVDPGSLGRHAVYPWPDLPPWVHSGVISAPWGCGGVVTTAIDLATFGQVFLDKGQCGDSRILSPSTVAAMIRNQIPGIGAYWGDYYFPEGCYGLGWQPLRDCKGPRWGLTVASRAAFCHEGLGGSVLWVDPEYELVGVYLPVQVLPGPKPPAPCLPECGWKLFADSITAAVVEL